MQTIESGIAFTDEAFTKLVDYYSSHGFTVVSEITPRGKKFIARKKSQLDDSTNVDLFINIIERKRKQRKECDLFI